MSDIKIQNLDIEKALIQPNYAKALWLNYHKDDNTLKISDFDMGRIEAAWETLIPQWQQSGVMDENVYNFEYEQEDWNNAVDEGKEQGRDLTGYKASAGQKAGQITRCVTDGAVAAYTGTVAALNTGSFIGNVTGKATGKAAEKGAEQAGSKLAGETFFFISAALDVANAAAYLLDKPNEEASKAVNALGEEMGNQQSATMEAQNNLVSMDDELQTSADEAYVVNDDANTYMGEQKTMYDFYAETLKYLEAAKTAGHIFNEDELKLYDECIQYMTAINKEITTTQRNTTDTVKEVSENMSTYQAGFDEVAKTAGNVRGVTDYAESFDSATETMTKIESYSQTISAGAAGVDAARGATLAASSGIAWWMALLYGAAAVACAGAAVLDGKAASEQKQMSDQAGAEVAMRSQTQDMNEATEELYSAGVDNYEAYVELVDNLEYVVPDDIDVPVATALPDETPLSHIDDDNDDENDKKGKGKSGKSGKA